MTRVPEVIDVWFDSGTMPFAQHHAPHRNRDLFASGYPADFVCEGLDQTRGWFYSLVAVSTLLFDRPPARNVVCVGLMLDAEGRKMSKSQGNVVDPWEMIDTFGADAVRWHLVTSKQPWDLMRFSRDKVNEVVRHFLLPLWHTYSFYVLYANAVTGRAEQDRSPHDGSDEQLDRWILSRLAATVQAVSGGLDALDAVGPGRALAAFVEELSNWYVRRSRRRFWDEDPAAFATLRSCLLVVSRLLAPFCPFAADEIYENLDGSEPSVHLCTFPTEHEAGARDQELESDMALARETVRLGLIARERARVKVRQPLRLAVVCASGADRAAIQRMSDIICEELNVKQLRFVADPDELGSFEVKPNYRRLGPRFGKDTRLVPGAVAALDPGRVARTLRAGRTVAISIGGRVHELSSEDISIEARPLEHYEVHREGARAVALELDIDDALRQEGLVREVVRAVQVARKAAGLAVSARIALVLGGDDELLEAVRAHEAYLAGETLATSVLYDGAAIGQAFNVEQLELRVAVERAEAHAFTCDSNA